MIPFPPWKKHWDCLPYWQFKSIVQKTDYSDFFEVKSFQESSVMNYITEEIVYGKLILNH